MDELKLIPYTGIWWGYYSTIKKNEIMSFSATLMETEDTVK